MEKKEEEGGKEIGKSRSLKGSRSPGTRRKQETGKKISKVNLRFLCRGICKVGFYYGQIDWAEEIRSRFQNTVNLGMKGVSTFGRSIGVFKPF